MDALYCMRLAPFSANRAPPWRCLAEADAVWRSPRSGGGIGVFVYSEGLGHMEAVDTVECYAARQGYRFVRATRQEGDECSSRYAEDVFYRKHCYAAEQLRSVGWLLVLDADSAIVSAGRRIEEWIDDSKDVILYERWLSGELMAGNYLVKNSPAGHR